MQTISILGCGWLGLPLAERLIRLEYAVKGSTTTPEKISILKNSNIIPYQLTCGRSVEGDNVADFFKTEMLFVNIPFRRDFVDPFDYVEQMRAVVAQAVAAGVKFVVMASSTSVYPELNQQARETDKIATDDARSNALLAAERVFLDEPRFEATVIRFAGLYGPGREIGSFLKSGRVPFKAGNTPINLIHLDDCIGIVTAVFEKKIAGQILNACADAHPLRNDLYTHVAIAMGIKPPKFESKTDSPYKIVDNEKIRRLLDYRFIHPGPWGWIDRGAKR